MTENGKGRCRRGRFGIAGLPVCLSFACVLITRNGRTTMDERRRYPRTEINEPGLVSAGGSVMRCTVRNLSREGAAVDVDNAALVPARFRLVTDNGATVHECSIAWIQENRIGVTFMAVPQAGADKDEGG